MEIGSPVQLLESTSYTILANPPPSGNLAVGAILHNLSGFTLTVEAGGSTITVPPWVSYLVPYAASLKSFQVSTSSKQTVGTALVATLNIQYVNVQDSMPGGFPLSNQQASPTVHNVTWGFVNGQGVYPAITFYTNQNQEYSELLQFFGTLSVYSTTTGTASIYFVKQSDGSTIYTTTISYGTSTAPVSNSINANALDFYLFPGDSVGLLGSSSLNLSNTESYPSQITTVYKQ